MKNDFYFYRTYYPILGRVLLGLSLVVLTLASVCIIQLILRREPLYYASSRYGRLIALQPMVTLQAKQF
jgi:hypothetical protein